MNSAKIVFCFEEKLLKSYTHFNFLLKMQKKLIENPRNFT